MSWLPKKCVIVPVDFSAESIAAIDTALALVAQPADLHIVHVLPTMEIAEPGVIWGTIDDHARKHHALQALNERLADQRYADCRRIILVGDAGHEIANYAAESKAELIVLPSHGRTGISRLLIGSTAERVVRLAHCPVLVLRS